MHTNGFHLFQPFRPSQPSRLEFSEHPCRETSLSRLLLKVPENGEFWGRKGLLLTRSLWQWS
jgi:hypothetical protein